MTLVMAIAAVAVAAAAPTAVPGAMFACAASEYDVVLGGVHIERATVAHSLPESDTEGVRPQSCQSHAWSTASVP
jgi:hypothetical protein